jgi:hypothetical protein
MGSVSSTTSRGTGRRSCCCTASPTPAGSGGTRCRPWRRPDSRSSSPTWLSEDDWYNFRTWGGHPDADQVAAELEATGSLTPGLNWYRANVPPETWIGPPVRLPPAQAATMGV